MVCRCGESAGVIGQIRALWSQIGECVLSDQRVCRGTSGGVLGGRSDDGVLWQINGVCCDRSVGVVGQIGGFAVAIR